MRKQNIDPITVAFAKENCTGIAIHCLPCAYVEDVGFEGFKDWEFVIDLPKRRPHWACPRCGSKLLEARPVYPYRNDRRAFLGLEKRED